LRGSLFSDLFKRSLQPLHSLIDRVESLVDRVESLVDCLEFRIHFTSQGVGLEDAGSDQTRHDGDQHRDSEDDKLCDRLPVVSLAVVLYDSDFALSLCQSYLQLLDFLLQITKIRIDGRVHSRTSPEVIERWPTWVDYTEEIGTSAQQKF
jgi:hypothetical protein